MNKGLLICMFCLLFLPINAFGDLVHHSEFKHAGIYYDILYVDSINDMPDNCSNICIFHISQSNGYFIVIYILLQPQGYHNA